MIMPSLKSTAELITLPTYTEASIHASLNSKIGSSLVWIVVEGEDDVDIYEPLFNAENTKVMSSLDENGERGCEKVEKIVSNIRRDKPSAFIIGIRDKDYTGYEIPPLAFSDGIFTTDKRDIEMQILSSDKVRKAISSWDCNFPVVWSYCLKPARFLGYLRIYNHVGNKGLGFKRKLKQNKYWDSLNSCLVPDWKDRVIALFSDKIDEKDLNSFIHQKNLEKESDWDICRGHDLINILQYRDAKYNCIPSIMLANYDRDEFSKSNLYKNLLSWSVSVSKQIF